MSQNELSTGARISALENRLLKLEQFLPILAEVFAGRIGGTSEESNAVFEAIGNADPEALKVALAANAGAAKSTENQAQELAPIVQTKPDNAAG